MALNSTRSQTNSPDENAGCFELYSVFARILISNHISCAGPNICTCILSLNIPVQREVTSIKCPEFFICASIFFCFEAKIANDLINHL